MTILKTNFGLYPELESLMDDFYSTEMNDWKRKNHSSDDATLPKVNIFENEKEFRIELAAPGMTRSNFKIELDKDVLSVSSDFNATDDRQYLKKEFSYESFQRAFSLPDTVDTEKIGASYENGILFITIPKMKARQHEPRKSISVS